MGPSQRQQQKPPAGRRRSHSSQNALLLLEVWPSIHCCPHRVEMTVQVFSKASVLTLAGDLVPTAETLPAWWHWWCCGLPKPHEGGREERMKITGRGKNCGSRLCSSVSDFAVSLQVFATENPPPHTICLHLHPLLHLLSSLFLTCHPRRGETRARCPFWFGLPNLKKK